MRETKRNLGLAPEPKAQALGLEDPQYETFVKEGIEAAVAEDIAAPENRVPIRDVWKKHGLEP